jgi:FkbM family methyltransferase
MNLRLAPVTIVDIGANIGLFSLRAGSLFPKAKIHAYEPNPRLKCHLSKNLEQVQGDFFLEAVGSKGGNGLCIDSGDSRMGIFENGAGDSKMIGFNTVLDRIGTQIDLLKIDCEGGEWEIFENPVPFQKVRSIRMEYHLLGGRTLDDLKKAADKIGFEIVKLEQNSRFGIAWLDALKS